MSIHTNSVGWFISWFHLILSPGHTLFYHLLYIFCLDITVCHWLSSSHQVSNVCYVTSLSKGGHSCSSILCLKLLAFAYEYLCFVPALGTHLNNTQFPISCLRFTSFGQSSTGRYRTSNFFFSAASPFQSHVFLCVCKLFHSLQFKCSVMTF